MLSLSCEKDIATPISQVLKLDRLITCKSLYRDNLWILENTTNFYGFVLVFCFLFRKIKFTSSVPIICLGLHWVLYIHYFRLMRISIFTIMKNEPFTIKETCHQPQLVNSRAWIWGECQLPLGSCSLVHLSPGVPRPKALTILSPLQFLRVVYAIANFEKLENFVLLNQEKACLYLAIKSVDPPNSVIHSCGTDPQWMLDLSGLLHCSTEMEDKGGVR